MKDQERRVHRLEFLYMFRAHSLFLFYNIYFSVFILPLSAAGTNMAMSLYIRRPDASDSSNWSSEEYKREAVCRPQTLHYAAGDTRSLIYIHILYTYIFIYMYISITNRLIEFKCASLCSWHNGTVNMQT